MVAKVKMIGFKTVEENSKLFVVQPQNTAELLEAYRQAEAYLASRPEIEMMEVTRINEDGRRILSELYNKAFSPSEATDESYDPYSKFYCI